MGTPISTELSSAAMFANNWLGLKLKVTGMQSAMMPKVILLVLFGTPDRLMSMLEDLELRGAQQTAAVIREKKILSRKRKAELQARWMDWVVNGDKLQVDHSFGMYSGHVNYDWKFELTFPSSC